MEEYYFKVRKREPIEELVNAVLEKTNIPFRKFMTGTYHTKTNNYEVLEALCDLGYIYNLEIVPKVSI